MLRACLITARWKIFIVVSYSAALLTLVNVCESWFQLVSALTAHLDCVKLEQGSLGILVSYFKEKVESELFYLLLVTIIFLCSYLCSIYIVATT